ncbi:MAG: toll/interleukin-1 receptor domain-containing protein [Ferruginibacter sp.]
MEKLDNEFIAELEIRLKSLPSLNEEVEREARWMTAEQIKDWSGIINNVADIDQFLCDEWQLGKLKNIRPAKHPHSSKLVTLWGHIENVWPVDPSAIQLSRLDEPMQLEQFDLPEEAPKIFISYSSVDLDLVQQLRKQLASKGFQSWLYVSEINRGRLIFDNVSSGIENSIAAIGFITRFSIGSAWVYTELMTTVKKGMLVYALFDAGDKELMQLLESLVPGTPGKYCSDLIKPLVDAYAVKGIEHNIKGYDYSIQALLNSLHYYSGIVMFPKRPEEWKGNEIFIDFPEFVQELLSLK